MATDLSNWSNFISNKQQHSVKPEVLGPTKYPSIKEVWSMAQKEKKTEPLDIKWVVENLFSLKIMERDLGEKASGFLNILDDRWCIFVNKFENERRKRFTIAHELGHFLLHKDKQSIPKDIIFFRDENTDQVEQEANNFASEFLMPEHKIYEYINEGYNTISALADKFCLSTPAVRYRLYKLGLISEY
ncbi:MAG: ImmA/IrrE family metallo-endopeptidase [Alphaproteobacteria bacterium]|nr:ImmA/IrrE family metallo-endopeptidase [Alphaproteobacteria bacterium]